MGQFCCSGRALTADARRRRRDVPARWSEAFHRRLWPTALLYGIMALAATALSERPNHYVADNRFEQYFNPSRSLLKMFAVWDGSRGLGAPREDVWIGTTIPVFALRAAGFSPAHTERIFHALCLVTAGLGVVVLVRLFRPRVGAEHLIAGLLTMFGPFSASFLLPSNLYIMFALSPWFVVIFIRGVSGDQPWRWAAVFALVVAAAGNSDTPGLLYTSVALLAAASYLVLIERLVRWRDVGLWVMRAAGLSLACGAWILAKTYYAAEALEARLADTELPSSSATSSSWSESFRGLGNWLSYFREQGQLLKPQTVVYLDSQWIILATFVPAILALVVLWKMRSRGLLLFGAMTIGGIVTMVGGFGVPNASPLGGLILDGFSNVTFLKSLRNTYKAGAGLVIGVSVLAAFGAVAIYRWCAERSRTQAIGAALVGTVLLISLAAPFATRSIYPPDEQVGEVPGYWYDAFEYLDGLPLGGRSLIVPAISQASYRWGYVGDDIFDALMTRPHATATGWMLSTRTGHNALEQITLNAQDPGYCGGVMAAMARRLGISEIVIRNDLDWAASSIARPALFKGLRSDPDFERVAQFGAPGQGVVASNDSSEEAEYERTLPPVEVYRLRSGLSLLDAHRPTGAGTVIASGDVGGWPSLVNAGILGPATAIAASAAMSDAEVVETLAKGSQVVITDTARRRVRNLLHHQPELSPTLAEGQELDRPVRPVYPDVAGAESVAWFRDASSITGAYVRLGGNRNDQRASLAFDGDPQTAWAVPWSGIGPRPSLTVTLRRPTSVHRMVVQSAVTPLGLPTVTGLEVGFSDGSMVTVDVDSSGRAEIDFPARVTSVINFAVSDIGVFGTVVGLAEVSVAGLDLVEHIQVARDLFVRGAPAVLDALRDAPTAYTFSRVSRVVSAVRADPMTTSYDEELAIRRRFEVVRRDEFTVSGTLRLLSTTSDDLVGVLLGQPLNAVGHRPPGTSFDAPAALVLDGDPATWWVGGAIVGDAMTIKIPRQGVSSIRVSQPTDIGTARIHSISAEVGGRVASASFAPPGCSAASEPDCERVVLRFPKNTVGAFVTLRIRAIDDSDVYSPGLIRIAEVSIRGDQPNVIDRDAGVSGDCLELGLGVGPESGKLQTVGVRVTATVGEVLDHQAVPFESCALVSLSPGTQLLETATGTMFDQIAFVPVDGFLRTPPRQEVALQWIQTSPDRLEAVVASSGPVIIDLRTSFDPGWVLQVGGKSLSAVERDAGNSWTIVVDESAQITVLYEPSIRVRWAMIGSMIAMVGCVALALRKPRRLPSIPLLVESMPVNGFDVPPPAASSFQRDVLTVVGSTALGVALAGPWALAIGAVTLLLIKPFPEWRMSVGLAPPVLLAATAVWSAVTHPDAPVNIDYAAQRWGPSALAALAVVFLFQSVALAAVDARRSQAPGPDRDA